MHHRCYKYMLQQSLLSTMAAVHALARHPVGPDASAHLSSVHVSLDGGGGSSEVSCSLTGCVDPDGRYSSMTTKTYAAPPSAGMTASVAPSLKTKASSVHATTPVAPTVRFAWRGRG